VRQVYPEVVDGQAPTKIWVDKVGLKHVRLDSDGPIATDAIDTKITTGSSDDSKEDNAVVQDVAATSPSNGASSQPLDGISQGPTALQDGDNDRA
jgi:hypothetical protein